MNSILKPLCPGVLLSALAWLGGQTRGFPAAVLGAGVPGAGGAVWDPFSWPEDPDVRSFIPAVGPCSRAAVGPFRKASICRPQLHPLDPSLRFW